MPYAVSASADRQLERLQALVDLSRFALRREGVDVVLDRALATLGAAMPAGRFAVLERDDGNARLVVRTGHGSAGTVAFEFGEPGGAGFRIVADDPASLDVTEYPDLQSYADRLVSVPIGSFGALAWIDGDVEPADQDLEFLRATSSLLAAAIHREHTDEALRESERRMRLAQQMAGFGSYDWEIATDTNIWSDQLYRIYGAEPHSFNASYERFLSFIHPDDLERVIATHKKALDERSSWEMDERIVRPDGEERILRTNGTVVCDEQGTPLRMVGVCMDITEQHRAQEELRRSAERFRSLVESAPDAVLLLDEDGRILQVNEECERLLGYAPEDLIGERIETLLPPELRGMHEGFRAEFVRGRKSRPMAVGREIFAIRKTGERVFLDVALGLIESEGSTLVTAFARDATMRRRLHELARIQHDVEVSRRHALEINDNVVQGLSAVVYALESEAAPLALEAARRTLDSARSMMTSLLHHPAADVEPGALARERPAQSYLPIEDLAASREISVLVVDDAEDLRMLLRQALGREPDIYIAGEAADGRAAVEAAARLEPDVVLLDLAMPVMDGLEALPLIRSGSPRSKVIVLTGFGDESVRTQALERGAHAYLEKGTPLVELLDAVRAAAAEIEPPLPDSDVDALADATTLPRTVMHEIRSPLAVLSGTAETLRARWERLTPEEIDALTGAIGRNAMTLNRLLDDIDDVRRLGEGSLSLHAEPLELGALVRETTSDFSRVVERSIRTDIDGEFPVIADGERVRQILRNLLSNAAKFGEPPIVVEVRTSDDRVELSVSDAGEGVPHERADDLFGKFVRLHPELPGTGLGLHVSRGIARALGGDLKLAERRGSGATFVLTLPSATGSNGLRSA